MTAATSTTLTPSTPSSSRPYKAKIFLSPSRTTLPPHLSLPILQSCQSALNTRNAFTIALSGGSLPSLLRSLPQSFEACGIDPQWEKWHVLLADERCVKSTHEDSNLGAIRENFTKFVPIPSSQIYGIEEGLLDDGCGKNNEGSTGDIATSYEEKVLRPLLEKCDGMLDCVVLGFGPDGHTCSLFPNHPLLQEQSALVAAIDDSPKPPPSRITLTFPVLNKLSRQIIFCGTGSSKTPILKAVFGNAVEVERDSHFFLNNAAEKVVAEGAKVFEVEMNDPAPFPCGMVRTMDGMDSLVWVIDADAAGDAMSA